MDDGSSIMAGFEPANLIQVSVPELPSPPPKFCQDLARTIAALAEDGYSADEIGKQLGIPRARAIRIARRKGIELAQAGGRRHIMVSLPAKHMQLVGALASSANVTRAEMLARLAMAMLADGESRARSRLGSLARPKRQYRPRSTLDR